MELLAENLSSNSETGFISKRVAITKKTCQSLVIEMICFRKKSQNNQVGNKNIQRLLDYRDIVNPDS